MYCWITLDFNEDRISSSVPIMKAPHTAVQLKNMKTQIDMNSRKKVNISKGYV